jgi:hypothetical protein
MEPLVKDALGSLDTMRRIRRIFIESLHLNLREEDFNYEAKLDEAAGLDSVAVAPPSRISAGSLRETGASPGQQLARICRRFLAAERVWAGSSRGAAKVEGAAQRSGCFAAVQPPLRPSSQHSQWLLLTRLADSVYLVLSDPAHQSGLA